LDKTVLFLTVKLFNQKTNDDEKQKQQNKNDQKNKK
jgi:large-conductance mechanosensitive channel